MEFADVDAIVLFTDGAPDATGERAGVDSQKEILALAKSWKSSHPSARIHTVGIGDYFNPKMRDFLLGLANETGGAFIGR